MVDIEPDCRRFVHCLLSHLIPSVPGLHFIYNKIKMSLWIMKTFKEMLDYIIQSTKNNTNENSLYKYNAI